MKAGKLAGWSEQMTREERQQRNESILEYAKQHGIAEAAKQFDVSYSSAYGVCRTAGVKLPRRVNATASLSTYGILKKLLDGQRQADIARDFNVSRQRVEQIQRKAEEAGFQFGDTR